MRFVRASVRLWGIISLGEVEDFGKKASLSQQIFQSPSGWRRRSTLAVEREVNKNTNQDNLYSARTIELLLHVYRHDKVLE
jgi:hypothetical protein